MVVWENHIITELVDVMVGVRRVAGPQPEPPSPKDLPIDLTDQEAVDFMRSLELLTRKQRQKVKLAFKQANETDDFRKLTEWFGYLEAVNETLRVLARFVGPDIVAEDDDLGGAVRPSRVRCGPMDS